MEGLFKTDDDVLRPTTDLDAVRAHQLDRAFDGLRTRREQEDLLQRRGHQVGQALDEVGADFVREAVVSQQPVACLLLNGFDDLFAAVAGVGDQHAARPVDPAVPPAVPHAVVLGAVPHHRRLALHGDGLVVVQLLQNRQRLGHGEISDDAPQSGLHTLHRTGDEFVGSSHETTIVG